MGFGKQLLILLFLSSTMFAPTACDRNAACCMDLCHADLGSVLPAGTNYTIEYDFQDIGIRGCDWDHRHIVLHCNQTDKLRIGVCDEKTLGVPLKICTEDDCSLVYVKKSDICDNGEIDSPLVCPALFIPVFLGFAAFRS